MANALPMSRTKWALNGPVSGTAAGRRAYQSAGAASIQAALARFTRPKTPSAQAQGSVRSACAIGDPPRAAACAGRTWHRGPRAAGSSVRRELLAQRGGEPRDTLIDRRHVDRGEAEGDVIGAPAARVQQLAAPVGHPARPRGLFEAVGVGAGREPDPDEVT